MEKDNIIQFQKQELSDAKWCSIEELTKLIRPYHLERLNIINNVDSLLNKYTQYIYGWICIQTLMTLVLILKSPSAKNLMKMR